jgi:hypothetical protein
MTQMGHRVGGQPSDSDGSWYGYLEQVLDEAVNPNGGAVAHEDPYRALTRITACAVRHLPGVDHAGITVVDPHGVIRSVAPTDGYLLVLDNLQRHFLEGPCYEAAATKHTLRVDDLSREQHWPSFTAKALASTPVRAVVALPIFDRDGAHSALNLYADHAGAMNARTEDGGSLVARYLARAMMRPRRKPLRKLALGSDSIGAAKRSLMQRFGMDAVQALSVLVKTSRREGISLEVLCARMMDARQPHDPQVSASTAGD